ncbi:hypothetical protein [Latilactobacillus sakei]|uniref:hypothetical protein n=1 Tax=Latilactobacillus sakei TaxID=1599 RepID=UPI00077CBB82|nr:hypothetical protein [Latilactobacillus sakei]VTU49695.1 hypothetical protein [Lactobacillus curvatus] [Latilactobacillus sakei]
MTKIEVQLDKYHLVASLLTVAGACLQLEDLEANEMGKAIEKTATKLWQELPQDYRHLVELDEVEG